MQDKVEVYIGTKYFIKYLVIFLLLPFQFILACFYLDDIFLNILGVLLLVFFSIPIAVRYFSPVILITKGEAFKLSLFGRKSSMGMVTGCKYEESNNEVYLWIDSDNKFTIKKMDFFRREWEENKGKLRGFAERFSSCDG